MQPASSIFAAQAESAAAAAVAWMMKKTLSRASIHRQSQVRGGGMGARQGMARGTRFACKRVQMAEPQAGPTPKQHSEFSLCNYFT